MKRLSSIAGLVALATFATPLLASAQVYYYAPNTTSGAFNYGSSLSNYIPAAAMPYVAYGQQMQQQYQQQYGGYMPYMNTSYPAQYQPQYQYQNQYQSQSQYQYQNSYPTYQNNMYPTTYSSQYGYTGTPTYGNSYGYNGMNQYGEYSSQPQSYSYPSGTYGPFGTQLCYWSDFSTYEPCGQDPNQWVRDPYTGGWY